MTHDPQQTQQTVSAVVRTCLAASRETQDDLAEVLGLPRPAVTARLSGRTRWTLDDVEQLASHYGISADALIRGSVLRGLPCSQGAGVS